MSKIHDTITQRTRATFHLDEENPGKTQRKMISFKPSLTSLAAVDTLADILGDSRQGLMDELLHHAVEDAIDAYCQAHGTGQKEAEQDFWKRYQHRLDELVQTLSSSEAKS